MLRSPPPALKLSPRTVQHEHPQHPRIPFHSRQHVGPASSGRLLLRRRRRCLRWRLLVAVRRPTRPSSAAYPHRLVARCGDEGVPRVQGSRAQACLGDVHHLGLLELGNVWTGVQGEAAESTTSRIGEGCGVDKLVGRCCCVRVGNGCSERLDDSSEKKRRTAAAASDARFAECSVVDACDAQIGSRW